VHRFGAHLHNLRGAMRSTGNSRSAMATARSCGAAFTCGLRETSEACWCARAAETRGIDPALDCLCPACLPRAVERSRRRRR
jgi:hypothetical protein